jgi:predicted CopG family antitoxin
MASINITISPEAHTRLKKFKRARKESFTDVILRELPEPCDTGREILDSLRRDYPPGARRRRKDAA